MFQELVTSFYSFTTQNVIPILGAEAQNLGSTMTMNAQNVRHKD